MAITAKRVLALWMVFALTFVTQRPLAARVSHSDSDVRTTTAVRAQEDKTKKKGDKKKKETDEKGTLETFESEATGDRPDSTQSSVSGESGESGESSGWWAFLGELTAYIFLAGAVGSWYRVTGHPADDDLEELYGERQAGEPGLPFVNLNLSYQNVKSDIEALDVNAEGGFGPLGVHYRFTRFQEEDPRTDLDLSWLHGVLRLSYTKYFEVGIGLGAVYLEGTGRESGFSFEIPLRLDPSRYFGFDYRPTWGWINGNTIGDHDLALRLGVRYVSIRGGYRWTNAGGSTLKGPIIGLLLTY